MGPLGPLGPLSGFRLWIKSRFFSKPENAVPQVHTRDQKGWISPVTLFFLLSLTARQLTHTPSRRLCCYVVYVRSTPRTARCDLTRHAATWSNKLLMQRAQLPMDLTEAWSL